MDRNKARDMQHHKGDLGINAPAIVSPQAWEAARQQMLVKEKALTRARDALTEGHRAPEGTNGLEDAVVHHHGQLRRRLRR